VALVPLIADVTPAGAALLLAAALALLGFGAAASLVEASLFGPAPPDGKAARSLPARAAWLADRCRPSLVALLLLQVVALVGAALLTVPVARAVAGAAGVADSVALLTAAALATVLWVALGVVVPRAMATRDRPVDAAVAAVYPAVRLVLPVAVVLAGLLDRARARPRQPAEPISAEDVRSMAGGDDADEPFGEEEAALIHSILEFGETTVREVMVGRVDMIALPVTASFDDALTLIRESGHSRIPLYGDNLDDIRGVLHAKDLLPLAGPRRPEDGAVDWQAVARRARFVPPGRNLDALLADLRLHRTHLAIVVDEYGGTLGIVTLEDLLEEVVGEIRDELDEPEDEPRLVPDGPDSFRADARLDLDDFFEALGMEVDTDEFAFETVGGLVFHLAGAVPVEGHEVTFEHLQLRVESLEANRIREVRVRVGAAPADRPVRVSDP
jgi:CBS domain containing-hemolysin-like protein